MRLPGIILLHFHNSSINKFSLFHFTNLLNAHEFEVDKHGIIMNNTDYEVNDRRNVINVSSFLPR